MKGFGGSFNFFIFSFKHHNLDKLNWVSLDSCVQTRNNPGYYLDVLKCFSCRFLLVPNIDYLISVAIAEQRGDVFNCDEIFQPERLEFNFIRFVEIINRMRNNAATQHPRQPSVASSGPTEKQAHEFLEQHVASFPPFLTVNIIHHLTIEKPDEILQTYLSIVISNPLQHTITQDVLPPNIIVSYDFVVWLRCHVFGLFEKKNALDFCQQLVKTKKIQILQRG